MASVTMLSKGSVSLPFSSPPPLPLLMCTYVCVCVCVRACSLAHVLSLSLSNNQINQIFFKKDESRVEEPTKDSEVLVTSNNGVFTIPKRD